MTQSYSPSFNQDFCEEFEYVLCYVFDKSEDAELNRSYLSNEKVQERGMIETTAYSGVSGQDRYTLKINL
jgi:hypothetical protein